MCNHKLDRTESQDAAQPKEKSLKVASDPLEVGANAGNELDYPLFGDDILAHLASVRATSALPRKRKNPEDRRRGKSVAETVEIFRALWAKHNDRGTGSSETDEMGESLLRDLRRSPPTLHLGSTGSGKSYKSRLVLASLYLAGYKLLYAVPTLHLAEEAIEDLRKLVPQAFANGEVAEIFGGQPGRAGNETDSENAIDDARYPIDETTRIIVCTHAQLRHRGLSRYMCRLLNVLNNRDRVGNARFKIIIDEFSEFISGSRRAIELEHRVTNRVEPDGVLTRLIPIQKCPKAVGAGNCASCTLRPYGGSPRFNQYGYRELKPPSVIYRNEYGKETDPPKNALRVDVDRDLKLGERLQVGRNTWAARVLGYNGRDLVPGE
jgi:hypothetical protein